MMCRRAPTELKSVVGTFRKITVRLLLSLNSTFGASGCRRRLTQNGSRKEIDRVSALRPCRSFSRADQRLRSGHAGQTRKCPSWVASGRQLGAENRNSLAARSLTSPTSYPWPQPCSSLSPGSVQNAGQVMMVQSALPPKPDRSLDYLSGRQVHEGPEGGW